MPRFGKQVEDAVSKLQNLQSRVDELEALLAEQRGVESALRQSERQFWRLFEESLDAILIADDTGRYQRANPAACELLGYTEPELCRMRVHDLVVPDGDTSPEERFAAFVERGRERGEFRVVRADGDIRVAEYAACVVGPDIHLSILRDVTERRQAEQKQREAEERYRRIVETAQEGIWEMDAESRTTYVNAKMAAMLGYSEEEMLGRPVTDFMVDTELDDHAAQMRRRRGGTADRYERRFRHQDGSVRILAVSATALLNEHGEFAGSFAMFTDVSEQRYAEETLRENEERLRLALDITYEGVWDYDPRSGKVTCNARLAEMRGYTLEEYDTSEAAWRASVHPDDGPALAEAFEAHHEGRADEIDVTYRSRHRDGHYIWVRSRGRIVERDADGNAARVIGTSIDVTQRVKAEQALKVSERRYRTLARDFPDGALFLLDRDMRLLFADGSAFEAVGLTADELVGRTLSEAFTPEVLAIAEPHVRAALAGKPGGYELEFRGRVYHDQVVPVVGEDGAIHEVIVIARDITEARQRERALAESERRYRQLFEDAVLGVFRTTIDGRVLEVNPACARMFGFASPADLKASVKNVGTDLYDTPPERPDMITRIVRSSQPFVTEHRYRRRDGSLFHATLHAWAVADPEHDEPVIEGFIEDITQRKQTERALQESEALLNETQRIAKLGGWKIVPATNEVVWTDEIYRIHDLPVGNRPSLAEAIAYFHPADVPRLRAAIEHTIATGEPYDLELRLITAQGRRKWGRTLGHARVEDGAVVELYGTFQDITERKEAELSLRAAHERLALHVENTPLAIIEWDRDLRIRHWSTRAEEMFGWRADEIEGKTWSDWRFVHEEDEAGVAEVARALLECRSRSGVSRNRNYRKNGSIAHCEWHSSALTDDAGEVLSVMSLVLDVSERQQLEEQLRQSQKMEAVGQLAGGVAHDFNNILTSILGNVELLRMEATGDLAMEEAGLFDGLEQIERAAQRAATLTRQLLTFSRKQLIKPQVLDPARVVRDLEKMLRRLIPESISFDIHTPETGWSIRMDPGQLEQAVMNLVVNARDAMPDGGHLLLALANVELDHQSRERPHEATPGRYVRIAVSDTGCGMDAETLAHVFEPFFTTKPAGRGSGLGLATVHGIVKQCSGHIMVDSAPGRGATFRMYVPTVTAAATSAATDATAELQPGGHETVLICEDDLYVRELATRLLSEKGYAVLTANDAFDALEKARQHPGHIHLLISDVIMPRMNGRQLAEALAATRPSLRILFMSGYTGDVIGQQGIVRQAVNFLQKPFSPGDLLRCVRQVLEADHARR